MMSPRSETEAPVSHPFSDLETDSLVEVFPEGRRLVGSRCADCGRVMLGNRLVCSTCVGRSIEKIALPTTGVLYSFTRLHIGAEGVRTIGYVDLDHISVRALADIRDQGSPLRPDQRVEFAASGDDWYFTPANGE